MTEIDCVFAGIAGGGIAGTCLVIAMIRFIKQDYAMRFAQLQMQIDKLRYELTDD